MIRRFILCSVLFFVTAITLTGCGDSTPKARNNQPAGTGKVNVYVVNYPLKYFAQRIGGENVDVVFPAPKEGDPAFWTPDAKTISAYQKADLILLNGADYAKWVKKTSLPSSKMNNTSSGFAKLYLKMDDSIVHSHGPKGTHSHEGFHFTTWLNPKLAIQQADAIRQALSRLRPQHEQTFQTNFDALKKDLEALDKQMEEIVRLAPKTQVIFSHPVYEYFGERYNIVRKSVHWEPDEVPTEKMWEELKKMLEKHPAKWMVWEGEPKEESVKRLAMMGVQSVVFDPCGNTPERGDYLEVMQANVKALAKVFSP